VFYNFKPITMKLIFMNRQFDYFLVFHDHFEDNHPDTIQVRRNYNNTQLYIIMSIKLVHGGRAEKSIRLISNSNNRVYTSLGIHCPGQNSKDI